MPHDNGLGPYTFCKRGRSHCSDQTCECVDTAKYRAMYELERERRGWNLGPHHFSLAIWLFYCALFGASTGLVIVTLYAAWEQLK